MASFGTTEISLWLHISFSFLKEPRPPNRISGAAKLLLARGVICVIVIRFHPRIWSMYSCPDTICRWFTSSLSVSKSHFSFRKHEQNKNKHIGDRSSLVCCSLSFLSCFWIPDFPCRCPVLSLASDDLMLR